MTAVQIRPATVDSIATCDWGYCDGETVAERLDEATGVWLAVCKRHGAKLKRSSPGRGSCPVCGGNYALTVEGRFRLHRDGWITCSGSGRVAS